MENYTGGVYATTEDNRDRNTKIRIHEIKQNNNNENTNVGDNDDDLVTPSGYAVSILSEEQANLINLIGTSESKELAEVDGDLSISVDGPYIHWFDNTMLPYYTMKCSSEKVKGIT